MVEQDESFPLYTGPAQFFKLLSHPARLAILDVLSQDEACVCHLEAALGLRQAYISQQLAVLREASVIVDRRDGWNVFYRLADPQVIDLVKQAAQLLHQDNLPGPARYPENCPCPKCAAARA